MAQLFSNMARSVLASAIKANDTKLSVLSAIPFPAILTSANDWFYLTLDDDAGIEIVKVTAKAANDEYTVARGQQNTVARAFPAGASVGLRVTAADADAWTKGIASLINYAPLASPALTGTPTAPTQTAGDNSLKLANTAFVQTALSGYAFIKDPVFTGIPTVPTPANNNRSLQIVNSQWVENVFGLWTDIWCDPNAYQSIGYGMVQWGTSKTNASATTINFPVAFPNACFVFVGTVKNNTATTLCLKYSAFTKTNFTASISNTSNAYAAGDFSWMARGW